MSNPNVDNEQTGGACDVVGARAAMRLDGHKIAQDEKVWVVLPVDQFGGIRTAAE